MLNDRAEAKRRGTEKKLSMEVDWIGWRISLASWLISIPDTKIRKIMSQVHSLMAQTKVPIKELQSLVRRLLWLTSAWHYLRPLLVPLYKALSRLPVTMVGMDHVVFQCLVSNLSSDMVLQEDLTHHHHHSLAKDVTLVWVANTHVKALTEVHSLHLRSRRVWIGILDPNSPYRMLEDDAHAALAVVDLYHSPYL